MKDKLEPLETMTMEELFNYCDSPEGKKRIRQSEIRYRKAYWDGVHQVIKWMQEGATLR